jgi:hypothetical protein
LESQTPQELQLIAEELGLLSNSFSQPVPEWFERALTRIGGQNRYGQPNFRVVNGQKATEFAWGAERIKYPAAFLKEEKRVGYDVLRASGRKEFFEKESEIPETSQGDVIVPLIIKFSTQIGIPRHIIERWVSPEDLGGRYEWEKNRFDYDIEKAELVDALGPFPERGQYRHFLTIQTKDKRYRPLGPDVLEIIERVLRVQESVGRGKSYEQAVKDEVAEMQVRRAKQIKEYGEKWKDAFNTPRIKGNAFISVPDAFKKYTQEKSK